MKKARSFRRLGDRHSPVLLTGAFTGKARSPIVRTPRLDLVPAGVELARAEMAGREMLEKLLGVAVPESWPPLYYDKQALAHTLERLAAGPEQAGWWSYYVIRKAAPDLPAVTLGVAGYKGPPDQYGTVEIGYSILPEHQRSGYATEAALGLVQRAFTFPAVLRIVAETLPGLAASIRVLEKCHFSPGGRPSESSVLRFTLSRETFEKVFPK